MCSGQAVDPLLPYGDEGLPVVQIQKSIKKRVQETIFSVSFLDHFAFLDIYFLFFRRSTTTISFVFLTISPSKITDKTK